jgi:hypothetical protein
VATPQFNYVESLKPLLLTQVPILQNYYTKTKQSQRLFLNGMLDFFLETKLNPAATNVSFLDANLIKTIHYMFNECDFLSDELITEWYEKLSGQVKDAAATSKDETLEAKKHAVNKLKPFIDWLQESDEDDDDDDEDEEEDD